MLRTMMIFALVLTALAASGLSALADDGERIYQVDRVEVRREDERLVVVARGQANTGGFTNPRLEPAGEVEGVAVFDFLVDPPGATMVTQALAPHEASAAMDADPAVEAVRVRGGQGSVTAEVP